MKKQWKVILIVGCMTLMGTGSALANGIHRHATPAQMIHQGIRSGELTQHETHILIREGHHLARARDLAWADDYLTRRERIRLDELRHRFNHHIYRLKHNHHRRW